MKLTQQAIFSTDQLNDEMISPLEDKNELIIIDNDGFIDHFILDDNDHHPTAMIEYYCDITGSENKNINIGKVMNTFKVNNICFIIGCFSTNNDITNHYYMIDKGNETSPIKKAVLDNFFRIRNINEYQINNEENTYTKEISQKKI